MAYSAPSTRTSGEFITAAIWNQDVVNNVTFLANPPACRVTNSTTQNCNDATDTLLTFDTETFDTDSMHSTSVNTSRITMTTAGLYTVQFSGEFAAANDYAAAYAYLRLNGTTIIGRGAGGRSVVGFVTLFVNAQTVYKFAANDYVEVLVGQDNTAPATRTMGNHNFSAVWIGLG